jgi:putative toxin-antitoxin system antitoxin component (TIGR02293 family)
MSQKPFKKSSKPKKATGSASKLVPAKAGSVLRKWYYAEKRGATHPAETLSGALIIADKVAEGFPTEAVDEVIDSGMVEPDVVYELVVPRRTLADRKHKAKPLSSGQSDRLSRILRIYARAEEAIGDLSRASRWLHKENRALAGKRPIDLLGSDAGARAVEKVLGRIEHGVIS